jgi:branched-chain amino acid aminotransferase
VSLVILAVEPHLPPRNHFALPIPQPRFAINRIELVAFPVVISRERPQRISRSGPDARRMESQFVWKNGRFLSWNEATVHVSSHGLHYGTGVFEGIRCYQTDHGPAVFRLAAHLDRFFASAKVYGIKLRFTLEDLGRATLEVIWANEFTDCYIRPLAFYGSHTLSLHPRTCPVEVVILAWPWGAYLGPEAHKRGVHVKVSPWRKFSSAAIPATAKACGQYLNSILATEDARAGGFDEALLLNATGAIAEGPGENLFVVRNGQLFTNDESSSILPGITRDSVLRLASNLGIPTHIGELKIRDLESADEAFFTGTAVEITSVTKLDGHPIGRGLPGPVTNSLRNAYLNAAHGRDSATEDWLTFVSWDPPDLAGSRGKPER